MGDALEVDDHHVNVLRCILSTTVDNDEWKRKNLFHTYIQCGERTCKLVIDGGSTIHVVSKSAIARLNLKVEPHPQPFFRVAWVDKTTLPVTERFLVPIQLGDYKDEVYCDVFPMDVAHILLGRPWLYDLDVTNHGRENTYVFKSKGKNIILTPAKASGSP
jgi:hypothetical protein